MRPVFSFSVSAVEPVFVNAFLKSFAAASHSFSDCLMLMYSLLIVEPSTPAVDGSSRCSIFSCNLSTAISHLDFADAIVGICGSVPVVVVGWISYVVPDGLCYVSFRNSIGRSFTLGLASTDFSVYSWWTTACSLTVSPWRISYDSSSVDIIAISFSLEVSFLKPLL